MTEDIRKKLNIIIENNKDKTWQEVVEILNIELTKENMDQKEKEEIIEELLKGFKNKMNKTKIEEEDFSDINYGWLIGKLTNEGYKNRLTKKYGYDFKTISNFIDELNNEWMNTVFDHNNSSDVIQDVILKGTTKEAWKKIINDIKEIEEEKETYDIINMVNQSHDELVAREKIRNENRQRYLKEKSIKEEKSRKRKKTLTIVSVATAVTLAVSGISILVYNANKDKIKRYQLEKKIEHNLKERFEFAYKDGAKPIFGVYTNDSDGVPNNIDWEEFERDAQYFTEVHKPLLRYQGNDLTEEERLKKELVLASIAYGNRKYGSGKEFSEAVARHLGVYEEYSDYDYETYVDDIADEIERRGGR